MASCVFRCFYSLRSRRVALSLELFSFRSARAAERTLAACCLLPSRPKLIATTCGAGGGCKLGFVRTLACVVKLVPSRSLLAHLLLSSGFDLFAHRSLLALSQIGVSSVLGLKGDQFAASQLRPDGVCGLAMLEAAKLASFAHAGASYPSVHALGSSFKACLTAVLAKRVAGCSTLFTQLVSDLASCLKIGCNLATSASSTLVAGVLAPSRARAGCRLMMACGSYISYDLKRVVGTISRRLSLMRLACGLATLAALNLQFVHAFVLNRPRLAVEA